MDKDKLKAIIEERVKFLRKMKNLIKRDKAEKEIFDYKIIELKLVLSIIDKEL